MNKKIECFGLSAQIVEQKINFTQSDKKYYCGANEFYLEVDNIAKYYIDARSNTIFIEKHPNLIDSNTINTWLYGSVFAYLLQYHGYLVLHGSAVMVNGHAVIFSGDSGAGKSTLATKFVARGYNLLTDDVVAITYNKNHELVMVPGHSKVKLWLNALEHFGKSQKDLKQVFNKIEKYEVPIVLHQTTAIKIKEFYELNHSDMINEVSLKKITGIEKINLLISNTYRYSMLNALENGLKTHLQQISELAKTINTYKIIRPAHQYLLDELADLIEAQFIFE